MPNEDNEGNSAAHTPNSEGLRGSAINIHRFLRKQDIHPYLYHLFQHLLSSRR